MRLTTLAGALSFLVLNACAAMPAAPTAEDEAEVVSKQTNEPLSVAEEAAWKRLIAQPTNKMSVQARLERAELVEETPAAIRALFTKPVSVKLGADQKPVQPFQLTGVVVPYAQALVMIKLTDKRDYMLTSPARATMVGAPSPKNETELTRKFQAMKAGSLLKADSPNDDDFVVSPVESAEFLFTKDKDMIKIELPLTAGDILPGSNLNPTLAADTDSCGKTMKGRSAEDIALALASLPAQNRALITEVDVAATRNPLDGIFSQVYRPNFRAGMLANLSPLGVVVGFPTIAQSCDGKEEIPAQSPLEITNTLAHESGHVWSFKTFGRDPLSKEWVAWRNAMKEDVLSVSGYAQSSFLEDVAEMVLIYGAVVHQEPRTAELTQLAGEMKALFPNRWAILEKVFK